jgi:hypothetical protein
LSTRTSLLESAEIVSDGTTRRTESPPTSRDAREWTRLLFGRLNFDERGPFITRAMQTDAICLKEEGNEHFRARRDPEAIIAAENADEVDAD